jgi:hypothetical protein
MGIKNIGWSIEIAHKASLKIKKRPPFQYVIPAPVFTRINSSGNLVSYLLAYTLDSRLPATIAFRAGFRGNGREVET